MWGGVSTFPQNPHVSIQSIFLVLVYWDMCSLYLMFRKIDKGKKVWIKNLKKNRPGKHSHGHSWRRKDKREIQKEFSIVHPPLGLKKMRENFFIPFPECRSCVKGSNPHPTPFMIEVFYFDNRTRFFFLHMILFSVQGIKIWWVQESSLFRMYRYLPWLTDRRCLFIFSGGTLRWSQKLIGKKSRIKWTDPSPSSVRNFLLHYPLFSSRHKSRLSAEEAKAKKKNLYQNFFVWCRE